MALAEFEAIIRRPDDWKKHCRWLQPTE